MGPEQLVQPLYSELSDDPDLREIVEMFVDEMPERIQALEKKFSLGDMEGLRRLAHQLKGAAGSYGFPTISLAAAELETAIRENAPSDIVEDRLSALVSLCRKAAVAPLDE